MAYCDRCERSFPNFIAFRQHLHDSPDHNLCDDCDKDFTSWLALKQHWTQSPRHSYCQYCNDHFDDRVELIDHYTTNHGYCEPCDRLFMNVNCLCEHFRQFHDYYCLSCQRVFQTHSNLRAASTLTHLSMSPPNILMLSTWDLAHTNQEMCNVPFVMSVGRHSFPDLLLYCTSRRIHVDLVSALIMSVSVPPGWSTSLITASFRTCSIASLFLLWHYYIPSRGTSTDALHVGWNSISSVPCGSTLRTNAMTI